jgi:hypothetical protein
MLDFWLAASDEHEFAERLRGATTLQPEDTLKAVERY